MNFNDWFVVILVCLGLAYAIFKDPVDAWLRKKGIRHDKDEEKSTLTKEEQQNER